MDNNLLTLTEVYNDIYHIFFNKFSVMTIKKYVASLFMKHEFDEIIQIIEQVTYTITKPHPSTFTKEEIIMSTKIVDKLILFEKIVNDAYKYIYKSVECIIIPDLSNIVMEYIEEPSIIYKFKY